MSGDRSTPQSSVSTADRRDRRPQVRDVRTDSDREADSKRGDESGLTAAEASNRLDRYGPNAVEEEQHSLLVEILSHFWGPIPWMIETALVLTALTRRWVDFGIIAALLVLNGAVGFWEEHQAQSAIVALKKRLARSAEVQRDGRWATVPSEQVVPGDLARASRGQILPADGILVTGTCETDESALTGESLPVDKGPGDSLFSGSAVSRGGPTFRVLATGTETMFGRTAQLAGRSAPVSHFQQAILRIGRYLIALAGVLIAVMVVVSLARGTGLPRTLEFALVVTIASVPVALPAVLSVTMAVGARGLARHEAVVSHLPAVEEMAGVDVLCADKTGTITKNQLAVAEVTVLDPDLTRDEVLRDADLTAEPDTDDPIDQAIRAATDDEAVQGWTQTGLEPFDPIRKRAQATVQGPHGERRRVVKGAVQAVLDLVGPNDAVSERLEQATTDLAAKGHRALAVARQDGGGSWQVTGVLALADPPRDDSAETLSQAVRLGVDIKIVTGDREEIAREIAKQIGLGDQVLPASRIQNAEITQVADAVERADGFAEVVPEDKYRIVRALQEHEHIVAMTGDGVNDAAALRRADAGIAVSGATDAARAASDIVLLAPGLSTIVDAIYRSREVFGRMKNYAIYRITETIRVVCFVTLTIVVLGFFPVTPVQVVLLAILNDAAILSIAYDRVRPSSRPERWDLSEVIIIAAVLGIVGMLSTFALVLISQDAVGLDEATLRTLVYLKLSVSGHLTVFLARTRGPFWSTRPAGILVLAVVGTQVLATIIALTGFLMAPIGWGLVALAWGWAVLEFLLLDPIKLLTYGALRRQGRAAPSPQRDPTRTGSAARVTGGRATANGSAAARTHGRSARR